MLIKTKGIVLGYIPYRETSIIAKIYTQELGIQSYIENSVRSPKVRPRMALFQPLTLLDLVVYHNDRKALHRISEMKCFRPYISIPLEISKYSIVLFLTEILNKTLKEESSNPTLYDFIENAFLYLDQSSQTENFHIHFLLRLMIFLGFAPTNALQIQAQFQENNIHLIFDGEAQRAINSFLNTQIEVDIPISRALRVHLLEVILTFYRLHIENFGEIKSLPVLQEVLR